MAYRLAVGEDDLPAGLRACAREQLDGALAQLERAALAQGDAIHETRKHLKKTRALLRLMRPALGGERYRSESAALRDAGRALSSARDADVLVDTAARLAERFPGMLPADVYAELVEALTREATAASAVELGALTAVLREARERVADWPLDGIEWDALVAGAARAYGRGRDALTLVREGATVERLHEWRKRAKDLWYHERLLQQAWPEVMTARIAQLHLLTEQLGEHNDLTLLERRLGDPAPLAPAVDAARERLLTLAARRTAELRTAAMAGGERVYAETPKAYARRLGGWLRVAVSEARAAAG